MVGPFINYVVKQLSMLLNKFIVIRIVQEGEGDKNSENTSNVVYECFLYKIKRKQQKFCNIPD